MDEQTDRPKRNELKTRNVEQVNKTYPETKEPTVRWLTSEELDELRRDMKEASAWARAELKRRREGE